MNKKKPNSINNDALKVVYFEPIPPVDKKLLRIFHEKNEGKDSLKIIPKDIITIEIGYGLIALCNKDLKGNIFEYIEYLRSDIVYEYGIKLPSIGIIDNPDLDIYEYCIKIRGEIFGQYIIPQNEYIAIDPGDVKKKIKGKKIKEPVFGISAFLISKDIVNIAVNAGYTVADSGMIIKVHLDHIAKENLEKILSYENSKKLLSDIKKKSPKLVEDVFNEFKFIEIKYVLQKILSEKISLVNIEVILELILYYSLKTRDIEEIAINIISRFKYSTK